MSSDRWTAETEDLVREYAGFNAEAILTALADAGLLLAPGGETRQEWIASLERTPRGAGLCDCYHPGDGESVPTSPATGRRMGHHCECRAVIAAATLLGAYSKTIHAAECGHGTAMDDIYASEVANDPPSHIGPWVAVSET